MEIVLENNLREKIGRLILEMVYMHTHTQSVGSQKSNARKLAKEQRNILLNGKVTGENETVFLIGKAVKPPAFCNI